MISPTSHHGQWSGASFKISGEKRQFLSQLAEDQKSKASISAPRYLYRRGKLKRPFRTHARDSAQHARRLGFFRHPSHTTPHSLRVGIEPACQQRRRTRYAKAARKADQHAHNFKKSVWPFFLDGVIPTSQWNSTTPCVGRKSVKEL
jgi:hypothetical protein